MKCLRQAAARCGVSVSVGGAALMLVVAARVCVPLGVGLPASSEPAFVAGVAGPNAWMPRTTYSTVRDDGAAIVKYSHSKVSE